MSLLGLFLVLALQFEGISGNSIFIYKRSGQDVTLSCPLVSRCTRIDWLYNRVVTESVTKSVGNSRSSTRLSVSSDCSLVIKNITAVDVGRYVCREAKTIDRTSVHLSVLTISQSPPDTDPSRDGEVTLACTLLTFFDNNLCQWTSFRWMNETETVLPDEEEGRTECVSRLIVRHQRDHDRKYTCQLVNKGNSVETEVFITVRKHDEQFSGLTQTYIIIGAAVGAVVVLVIIAAVLIKCRKRDKVTGDVQNPIQDPDEPESSLTYVTVSHANQQASPKKRVKQEDKVTYSTVKTPVMTDNKHSNLYSSVGSPR